MDICKDKIIFVVTKDDRLRQALSGVDRIMVVKDFDEFEKYIDSYFRNEYFVSRLKEEISQDITTESIKDIWLNTEGNWVIELANEEKKYYVQVDFASKEVINFTDFDFLQGINGLIVSGAFRTTHLGVSLINDYIAYFSNENIQNLIKAATENDQIFSIANDEDVKEFFSKLYEAKPQIIPEEIKEKFKQYFSIL